MHLEKRSKYPGVKIHLTKAECEELITARAKWDSGTIAARGFQLAKAITKAAKADPTLLTERNEAEIRESIETELAKLTKKLAAFDAGEPWQADHD